MLWSSSSSCYTLPHIPEFLHFFISWRSLSLNVHCLWMNHVAEVKCFIASCSSMIHNGCLLSPPDKVQNVSSAMCPMVTTPLPQGTHVLRKLVRSPTESFSMLEVKSSHFLTLQDWINSVFSMPAVPCVSPLKGRTLKDQTGSLRELISERNQAFD